MEAKLLIVDDEAHVRDSLREYFEREGFGVSVAEDGTAALAALNQATPNLLILDVQLPRVDGLQVCRAIRQKVGQAVGIIMISGIRKEMVDRVVGLEMGADVYVTKPFETRELLAQVRALLRRIETEQNARRDRRLARRGRSSADSLRAQIGRSGWSASPPDPFGI
jgi:DNA-binding response OmpR family regulator